jgi:alkylation response protein AidB-like acyl-CoA dehydrogenase
LNLQFSDELEGYRLKAKTWLDSVIPGWWHDYKTRYASEKRYNDFVTTWDRKLYDGGYSGISWPKEYGGQGKPLLQEMIFEEELGRIDAPKGRNFLGKILLGPTLLAYGTEEQKKHFLPRLIRSDDIWCQGFSEPNAGSDLASLGTRAELDGDEWVINGQKVWTTEAQNSNWCFLLARTDKSAPKHKGITYFLVPMNTEGVSVRPLRKITGEAEFNEIFFDNVRIPKDHYIGEINQGWKAAMTTLSFERGILALGRQSRFETEFKRALEITNGENDSEDSIFNKSDYKQKIAQAYMEIKIMRYHSLKTISEYINNNGKLGPEASLQKLYWSEMRSRLGKLMMELQGDDVYLSKEDSPTGDYFTKIYYTTRGETIYAGTSQIQRNILAEKVLDLPK